MDKYFFKFYSGFLGRREKVKIILSYIGLYGILVSFILISFKMYAFAVGAPSRETYIFVITIVTGIVIFAMCSMLHFITRAVTINSKMLSLSSRILPKSFVYNLDEIKHIYLETSDLDMIESIIIFIESSKRNYLRENIACNKIVLPGSIENIDELVVLLREYCENAFITAVE